jgi:hypothetical protein
VTGPTVAYQMGLFTGYIVWCLGITCPTHRDNLSYNLSYTPKSSILNDADHFVTASLFIMNCALRMTSFCCYKWSCEFLHFYKEKVLNENNSFHNFCLKWFVSNNIMQEKELSQTGISNPWITVHWFSIKNFKQL